MTAVNGDMGAHALLRLSDNVGAPNAPDLSGHRLVFVGGLHRSGTTAVARKLAEHPDVSGLSATSVPEDEGEHLQSVYVDSWELGGVGRFGFHPLSHMTERDPLVCDQSRRTLAAELGRYWDLRRPMLLEKSPPNLLKTRFLQALFPAASFVVVVRHPLAVTVATLKWRNRLRRALSPPELLQHWLRCHQLLLEDRVHVSRLAIVRYEDLVADSEGELARLFRFLQLAPHPVQLEVASGVNEGYFAEWGAMCRRPLYGRWLKRLEALESQAACFGYSIREPSRLGPWPWDTGDGAPSQRTSA